MIRISSIIIEFKHRAPALLAVGLLAISAWACDGSNDRNSADPMEASPRMGGGMPAPDLSASIEGNTIAVQVRVPANHHAYLDAGRDGVLIPISFDWQPLIDAALLRTAPSQVTAPEGSPDEEIGATVLRGAGKFVFETSQADRLDGMSVRVRSQLCNDETGVCYRPTWQEVAL